MALELFYNPGSASCRLVMLVAAVLNLDLDYIDVNQQSKDDTTPAFFKVNPQRSVPTLIDGDFVLWEPRAISRYLINKYGGSAGELLYPSDPRSRAVIDQRLDFDVGTLYPTFGYYYMPQLFSLSLPDEEWEKKLQVALGHLDTFLEGQEYAAGPKLTLADLSLVSTVATVDAAGIDLVKYPNIVRWFELVKNTAPAYNETSEKGLKMFKELIENMKQSRDEL